MANQVDTEQDVWVPYLGVNKPNVGKKIGWRNVATDEIRYQLDRPGESAPNEADKEDYTDFEVESFALDALPDMARRYAIEEQGGWETVRRANAIVDAMESAVIYASGDTIAATSKAYTDAVVGSISKEELEEREEIAKRIPKNGICMSPNGAPSNLSREDWITVRTKKFKQWFGDWEKHGGKNTLWSDSDVSKAVDANGEPVLVYHGTERGGFGAFENSKVGTQHAGFFFTTDRAVASTYAGTLESAVIHAPLPGFPLVDYLDEETDWGIYSCFLNIRDVQEHDFEGANWDGQKLPEEGTEDPVEYLGNSTWDASKQAEKLGSDGCIIRNVIDIGPNYRSRGDKESDIFVVFKAGNIKLATAKSFDSKNVDIRMSTWVKYKGPRGGEGWRNTKTDEVRYQAEMPTERDDDSQKTSFRVGDIENADSVLNRVKSSPQHPRDLDWDRYASRFGIEGDFRHVELPMAEIAKMIQSGYLRMSESLDDAEIARRVSSGKRNPVIITNEPGRNSLVVDGTHSLAAAIQAGDASVKAIVPVKKLAGSWAETAEPWQMTRQQFRESQSVWNHQTWEEFEKFDENKARAKFPRSAKSPDRLGVWFTDQVGLYGPINLEAHANVKNPLVFSDKADTGATAFEQMQKAMDAAGGPDNYRQRLLSQGFDGVLLKNTRTDLKKDGSKRQNILIALDWNSPSILSRIVDATAYDEGQSVPSAFDRHRAAVEQALASGKVVPPEVLADYPELQSGEEKAVVTMSTWVKYTGPRGGQGWRNIQTDEVRYQSDMPNDREPLTGFAKEVVDAIEQSGIPADYVRLLYSGFSSNSPLKAYQEDITVGLDGLSEDRGVTKKEIEQIKAYFKERSVAAARKAGIEFPFTAYRGEEINDTKPIIAMTRQQRTAAFHASKSKNRVLRQQEITEDDVLFWAEAFPGTFSEDEWIVKRKSQLPAVGVGSIALQAHIEQWATDRFKDRQTAKNFVQWFGSSKIVNDYGVPQIYYHGTHRPGFSEFKTDNPSDGVNKRETIAFSPDPDFASMYASENGGAVYPVFLKVENPADYRNDEHCKLLAKHWADNMREFLLTKANRAAWKVETDEALEKRVEEEYKKRLQQVRSGYWAAWEDKTFLEKYGFDGAYVQEVGGEENVSEPNLVVLDSSQIKSATGNDGTFGAGVNIAMSTWLKYEGPRGGRGWRNVETDEVRYQKDPPVDQLSTKEPQTFVRSFLELDDIEIEKRLDAKKQKLSSAIYQKYMEASGNDQHDERLKLVNELRQRVTLDLQFTKSMDSIPPDLAATFKATVESALKKIKSPHAIAALGRNVETVEYRKNIAEISLAACRIKHRKMPDGDEKRDIEFREMLNPTTVAFWTHNQLDAKHHGTLYLDGGELGEWKIEHVYLHEFGHAIDGHNKFSSTEQWKRVWQAEILMKEFSADRISDYSTVDASEGFAEFFRFVCLMPSLAEEKFPRCFEFFAQNNLV